MAAGGGERAERREELGEPRLSGMVQLQLNVVAQLEPGPLVRERERRCKGEAAPAWGGRLDWMGFNPREMRGGGSKTNGLRLGWEKEGEPA